MGVNFWDIMVGGGECWLGSMRKVMSSAMAKRSLLAMRLQKLSASMAGSIFCLNVGRYTVDGLRVGKWV